MTTLTLYIGFGISVLSGIIVYRNLRTFLIIEQGSQMVKDNQTRMRYLFSLTGLSDSIYTVCYALLFSLHLSIYIYYFCYI